MVTKIKNLIALLLMMVGPFSFSSCSKDEGAPRMLWDVLYSPEENVYAMAYIDYHPQITIIANSEEGEVTLTCTNYKSLSLGIQGNTTAQSITVAEMNFTATVMDDSTIKITFEKMPETFEVAIEATIKIYGFNGTDLNMCAARITRLPTNEEGD